MELKHSLVARYLYLSSSGSSSGSGSGAWPWLLLLRCARWYGRGLLA